MAERVAATRRNAQGAEAPVGESVETTPPELKHCWYAGPHGRQAALLLAWRQVNPGSAWEGNIAVAAPDGDGWAIVTMWVSASMLTPADAAR
ncbi:hypothetical protein ASG90_00845 [Nocardioides sp. Soil797]|nr:hypothetical protein ASG90_00845 [Nocardioides sp. Soil797]